MKSYGILALIFIIGVHNTVHRASAFLSSPSSSFSSSSSMTKQHQSLQPQRIAQTPPLLFAEPPSDDSLLDRFTNPVIDDPWLPLTEAGLAQVVAPSLQLFFLASARSPFPSWASPILLSNDQISSWYQLPRGSFLAPTLIHGAGLACCWLLGSLASKAYEKQVYEGSAGTVLVSTAKAGAFAVGLLIFGTQLDLYADMGGYVQVGDSVETDMRIYRASVEVINDCVFEAIVLLAWRFYRNAAAKYPMP